MKKMLALSVAIALAGLAFVGVGQAGEKKVINVIAQKHLSFTSSEEFLPEFEKANNVKVNITYFSEVDRRSKSRLDASTGAGSYQVYYIDEANVAEFVASGWVLPLLDYYPADYDYNDFLEGCRDVASVDGVPYFAPLEGTPDALFCRKDILEAKGIQPPKTIDELLAVVEKVHNPPEVYAFTGRGQRGSGINVWRWTQFFRAMGGKWLTDDGKINFNSEAGIKATETYKKLLSYGPPGTYTYSWSDCIESYRAGKVVFMIDTMTWSDWVENPETSAIPGKVIYAKQPDPIKTSGWGHGLAVSKLGCKDDETRKLAAKYIAWISSKEMEKNRVNKGLFNSVFRSSTLASDLFKEKVIPAVKEGMDANAPGAYVQIMRIPAWPQIGDELGIALEQYYTGEIATAKEALDQAAEKCNRILQRAERQKK